MDPDPTSYTANGRHHVVQSGLLWLRIPSNVCGVCVPGQGSVCNTEAPVPTF